MKRRGLHQASARQGPAVSAGRFRTCGVREEGALVCWGEAIGEIPEGRFTRVDSSATAAWAGTWHFDASEAEILRLLDEDLQAGRVPI